MNHLQTKFWALLAAGLISGCANNPVYEGRYPWDAGWREGVVNRIGEEDDLRRRYAHRCQAEASHPSTVRFAAVRWVEMGKARSQTVTIPKDSTLKVGDLVYVKVLDCAGRAVPRTMPKRSAAAPYRDQARFPGAECPLRPAVYTAACHA